MGTFASQGIWQWRTEKSAQCIPQNIQGLRGLHKKCLITHQVELKVNGRKKRKFSQNIFCKPWLDLSSKKEEETKIKFCNFRLYFFITWWDSNRWNTKTNAIDVGNSVSYFCCITTSKTFCRYVILGGSSGPFSLQLSHQDSVWAWPKTSRDQRSRWCHLSTIPGTTSHCLFSTEGDVSY